MENNLIKIAIHIIWCDDSTTINIEIKENDLELINRICELSEKASTYGCMPTICYDIF